MDLSALPEWASERAEALLRTGVPVPQIEERLVAQGLSPAAATAAVNKVLQDRIRQQGEPQERAERRRHLHWVLSAVVAGVSVLLAFGFFGAWAACRTGISVLLPLACIWFADRMGGSVSKPAGTGVSAGFFVRWCAWLLLAVLAIRVLWLGIALTRL